MTTGESLAGQTVEAARRMLAARFRNQAVDSAELDARMLVGAVLGLDLTGVIAAAWAAHSAVAQSPTRRPSGRRLMPTSITTAPGLMNSPVTKAGFPMAATRISPSRATAGRSRVLEWQMVSVAC